MTLLDLSQLRQVLDAATQVELAAGYGSSTTRSPTTSGTRARGGYALNSQAGELIRVIDLVQTRLPPELTSVAGDFWLIDGRQVVVMHYEPGGQFRAAEVLNAAQATEHRRAAAWELGEDFTILAATLRRLRRDAGPAHPVPPATPGRPGHRPVLHPAAR